MPSDIDILKINMNRTQVNTNKKGFVAICDKTYNEISLKYH